MIECYNISKRREGHGVGRDNCLPPRQAPSPTPISHGSRDILGVWKSRSFWKLKGTIAWPVIKRHKLQGGLIATQMGAKKATQDHRVSISSLSKPKVQIWPGKVYHAMKIRPLHKGTMTMILVVTCIFFSHRWFICSCCLRQNKNSPLQSWFL